MHESAIIIHRRSDRMLHTLLRRVFVFHGERVSRRRAKFRRDFTYRASLIKVARASELYRKLMKTSRSQRIAPRLLHLPRGSPVTFTYSLAREREPSFYSQRAELFVLSARVRDFREPCINDGLSFNKIAILCGRREEICRGDACMLLFHG